MALDNYSNFAYSTVAIATIDNTNGRTLTVLSGQGTRFPSAPFNVVVWPASTMAAPENAEIVRVTSRSGDILTLSRGQEGTSVKTIQVGYNVSAAITAKVFSDISSLSSSSGVSAGTAIAYSIALS